MFAIRYGIEMWFHKIAIPIKCIESLQTNRAQMLSGTRLLLTLYMSTVGLFGLLFVALVICNGH